MNHVELDILAMILNVKYVSHVGLVLFVKIGPQLMFQWEMIPCLVLIKPNHIHAPKDFFAHKTVRSLNHVHLVHSDQLKGQKK